MRTHQHMPGMPDDPADIADWTRRGLVNEIDALLTDIRRHNRSTGRAEEYAVYAGPVVRHFAGRVEVTR